MVTADHKGNTVSADKGAWKYNADCVTLLQNIAVSAGLFTLQLDHECGTRIYVQICEFDMHMRQHGYRIHQNSHYNM